MRCKRDRKLWLLVLCAGVTTLAGTCATNARDAMIGGAMDFVSSATSELLGQMIAQLLPAA